MQTSLHLGSSASLALGHRDQATSDSSHQGSCNEGCLHAERFVQLLGGHAAEAEEEDARRKQHGLSETRQVIVVRQFCTQTVMWVELGQGHSIMRAHM